MRRISYHGRAPCLVAANVGSWSAESVEAWAIGLEGFGRLGVAFYLFGIAIGLGTIITALRCQTARLRELAGV